MTFFVNFRGYHGQTAGLDCLSFSATGSNLLIQNEISRLPKMTSYGKGWRSNCYIFHESCF